METHQKNSLQHREGARREKVRFGGVLAAAVACYFLIQEADPGGTLIYVPQVLLFVAVIYLIALGAEWLVGSACRLAETLGISQLVIGLTVVAFGTSAPEGAVSLIAGFQGNGDITIANVVGSNIFNLCFILGGMALIVPRGLPVTGELVKRDAPLLLATTVLLFLFVGGLTTAEVSDRGFGFPMLRLFNLQLEWLEGALLMLVLVAYLLFLYRARRRGAGPARPILAGGEDADNVNNATTRENSGEGASTNVPLDIGIFLFGTALVVAGCHVMVGQVELVDGSWRGWGALWFAKRVGISDYVVGVTIVAAGTSAPEFAVSLVAAFKGRFEMTIGNLLGSDLFNMLGVVGLAGLVLQPPLAASVSVSPAAIGSLLALIALVTVTWFFMWSRGRISRWEGLILVLIGVSRWVMDFITQGV